MSCAWQRGVLCRHGLESLARETGMASRPSTEDLVAINDEIVALVRAGVPLEHGLGLLAKDLPGRLGSMAAELGKRIQRGATLAEAVGQESGEFPPLYQAVVRSGIRSGRLTVALEGLTTTLRHMADLRATTGVALLYPLLILLLAWASFLLYIIALVPSLTTLDVMGRALPDWLVRIRGSATIWGPLVPLLVVLALVAWWFLSARTAGTGGWLWAWIPRSGALRRYGSLATFAEVLSLLVEHDTPLPEALSLAGDSSGDRRLQRSGRRAAEAVEQGKSLAEAVRVAADLPPFLGLSSFAASGQSALVRAARQAAETYRRQAQRLAEALRLSLPVFFILVIGATVTISYALLLFLPWFHTLRDLALP